jgi:hypothetical protein
MRSKHAIGIAEHVGMTPSMQSSILPTVAVHEELGLASWYVHVASLCGELIVL